MRTFWCFISYRHADNKELGRQWATWLHQAIETYEVPADLVGTQNERGETIPERIFPVFRDEEELPVDADLASPIYRALDDSKYLLVICSPRAVESSYVASEIRYFKQLGREDRVLAAMIEGEPNASWDAGKQPDSADPSRECFPEPLRHRVNAEGHLLEEHTEPIAADFRLDDGAQGWTSPEAYRQALSSEGKLGAAEKSAAVEAYRKKCELMKLKIIAGILGVSLGTLTKRDAAYQLDLARTRGRVRNAVLTVVSVLAVAAVLAAVLAYQQKKEADKQQVEAERQKAEAIAEKEQAQETFARSDFLQAAALVKQDTASTGTGLDQAKKQLADDETTVVHSALPYLARSVRTKKANNPAAALAFSCLAAYSVPGVILQLQSEISSCSFSPDGKRVLTACAERGSSGYAQVYDAETGRTISPPIQHKGPVYSARFSPDSKWIVTASGNAAQVWDAQTGQPVSPPLQHQDAVNSANFSPDGKWVVTTSDDKTARVWDARSGQPVTPALRHQDTVTSARFSPDGKWVLTTSGGVDAKGGHAQVWDARTGNPVSTRVDDEYPLMDSATFSPDGKWFLTASANFGSWVRASGQKVGPGGHARVWESRTGKPVSPLIQSEYPINSASFSPDGKWILTAQEDANLTTGWARVFDAQSGKPVSPSLTHPSAVNFAKFSPDGSLMVTGDYGGLVKVWSTRDWRPCSTTFHHFASVSSASFSPDGRRVVTASGDHAFIWSIQGSVAISQRLPHKGGLTSASFSPDGTRAVTTSLDKTACVWDVSSGQAVAPPLRHKDAVLNASFSPDGKYLATASGDFVKKNGQAQVWDAQDGRPLSPPLLHRDAVNYVSFSPDGREIATASDDSTGRIWNARTGEPLSPPLQHHGEVVSAVFSPEGSMMVTASTDGSAQVWNARTGTAVSPPLKIFEGGKDTIYIIHNGVVGASFSPDGNRIATGLMGDSGKIWEPRTGHILSTIRQGTSFLPSTVAFSYDGQWLAVSGYDGTRIYSSYTGQPVSPQFDGDAAKFSPKGRWIVTTTDTSATIRDARTGRPVSLSLLHGGSVEFSPTGLRVITTSDDHAARIWDIAPESDPPDWLPDVVEAVAFQSLDNTGSAREFSAEKFNRIRAERLASTSNDPWEVFGRWLFSDPATRTISPWSSVTVPEYVQRLIAERTPGSLDEAESLSYGEGDVQKQIEAMRATLSEAAK